MSASNKKRRRTPVKDIEPARVSSDDPHHLGILIKKLRLQNEKLKKMIQVSPTAMMVVEAHTGALTEFNRAWSDILGVDGESFLQTPGFFKTLFCNAEEYKLVEHALRTKGTIVDQLCQMEALSRHRKTVQLYGTTFDRNGIQYYLLNFCDLTDVISNERTARSFEQKIRNLIRALDASSLVSVTD
ncbi:MAG TPA: PAS domain-containing protein, partial [Turneriella sp.]|nr:PAS domain-containing protein [Turneriella sp.]